MPEPIQATCFDNDHVNSAEEDVTNCHLPMATPPSIPRARFENDGFDGAM